MPPPAARADAIADAVLRLVGRDGIEAVSMRKVASEAGLSLGAVQRTYGDKRTLLRAALARSVQRADERIAARLDALGSAPGPADLLRAAALEVLPLDVETLAAERVWLAFIAHAAVDAEFGRPIGARYERSREAIAAFLAAARRDGRLGSGADPAVLATAFVALVDGLAAQVLAHLLTPDAALAAVEDHIGRLVA